MPSFFFLTWGDTIILLVTCFNQSISALFMSVHIVILDPPKKAYIVTLPDVCLDVHSACVCVGGGVIILLAGYLPDVHSVCVEGSFCLLVIYLMSIVWEWEGVRGHHSACWLPT